MLNPLFTFISDNVVIYWSAEPIPLPLVSYKILHNGNVWWQ